MSVSGAALLDPPEAEIARPEVVVQSQSTRMVLCSRSREDRSKVTVCADIHLENTGFATRPEPEVARPETAIAPVAGSSFGDITAVSSRSQSVESGSEVDVETLSGYPFPVRQKPEITTILFHPLGKPGFFIRVIGGIKQI